MGADVMNFGMEWELAPRTIVSARYSRNHLKRTIEDLGALDAEGNEIYSYGNPGESKFEVFPASGAFKGSRAQPWPCSSRPPP